MIYSGTVVPAYKTTVVFDKVKKRNRYMKKIVLMLLVFAFLAPSVFAAPTDDEIMLSFSAVFGVYGAVFITTMMGQTVPGAVMDMDMESGASTLTFDDVDTVALLTSIGENIDGSGDMPEVPFTRISGTFKTDQDGNMDMDVALTGGPVNLLKMTAEAGELTSINADGRDYSHLAEVMMNMDM